MGASFCWPYGGFACGVVSMGPVLLGGGEVREARGAVLVSL